MHTHDETHDRLLSCIEDGTFDTFDALPASYALHTDVHDETHDDFDPIEVHVTEVVRTYMNADGTIRAAVVVATFTTTYEDGGGVVEHTR